MRTEIETLLRKRKMIARQRPSWLLVCLLIYGGYILVRALLLPGPDDLMLVFACAGAVCYVEYRSVRASRLSIELIDRLQNAEDHIQELERRITP